MRNQYGRNTVDAYEYACNLMAYQQYDFCDAMFNAAQKFDVNQNDLEEYYDDSLANSQWATN